MWHLQAHCVGAAAQQLAVPRLAWTDIAGQFEQLAEELNTVTAASPKEAELSGCVASVSAQADQVLHSATPTQVSLKHCWLLMASRHETVVSKDAVRVWHVWASQSSLQRWTQGCPSFHSRRCRLCRQAVPDMKACQAVFQQLLWMLHRYLDGMTTVDPPITLSEGRPSVETVPEAADSTVQSEELAEVEFV